MSGGLNMGAMMGNLQNVMQNAVGKMKQMGEMANQIEQIQKIVGLIRNGGNPMELISAFAKQNPQAEQMMTTLDGKSPDELRAYAENMARSYGVNLADVAKSLGITLPGWP